MILDKFKLIGKNALVTGCSRGIGRAIAVGLAEAGADIIGVSRTLVQKESKLKQKIDLLNRKFTAYKADFSNRTELYGFINVLKKDELKIDILINNAGIVKRNYAIQYSDDDWDEVLEVNLNAQFILAREVGKQMLKRRNGKIIFISSLLSFQGGIEVPAYYSSKGGIVQLTKALSNEWSGKGINVNSIAPGYIQTDLTRPLQTDKRRNKSILNRIPAGRWGRPDDLVGAAVFLSSEASSYVSGEVITIDGGWLGR